MAKIKAITIHAGHNKPGKVACGASDYIDESKEARIICRKVKKLLKKNGVKAYNCTVNDGTSQSNVLTKIVNKCNAKSRDLDVSIHFNAYTHSKADGKTKGVEVCVHNSSSNMAIGIASKICNKISKIGFTNRGIKYRSDLYFLNRTTRPAILIEVCFVDDQDDAKLYKTNKNRIAEAIVQAIVLYN